jgi:hypothetical protein
MSITAKSTSRPLFVIGVAAGLQVAVLLLCWAVLASFDEHSHAIASATVQEPRPAVGALVPDAIAMLEAAAVVLAASIASWIATWLIARRWLVPKTARLPRWRLLIPFLSAELALAAAMALTPAVVGPGQFAAVVVALPNAAVLAVTMLGAALGLAVAIALPVATPLPTYEEVPTSTTLRVASWTLAVVAAALLALLVIPVAANRPIADDYRYFANIRGSGLGSFLVAHLQTETGRYTQGALIWLAFQAFGPAAIQVMPGLLIAALAAALLAALRVFAPERLRSWSVAVPLAICTALLAVIAMPSLPDSFLWLSASTVYLPGVIGWIVAVTCLGVAWRAAKWRRAGWTALSAIAAFLAQGCYEAVSALGVLAAVAITVVVVRSRHDRAGRLVPAIVLLLVSLAGLAIIGLAPSVQTRASTTAAGNILVGSFGAVFTDLQLWHGFGAGPWLLAVGIGIVLAIGLFPAPPRTALLTGWIGAAVLTLVPVVCGAISFLGLSWAPIRTYTVPALAFALGLALVVGAVGAALPRRLPQPLPRALQRLPAVALVVALVLGGGLMIPGLVRLAQAETLRAAAVDARNDSVAEQLLTTPSTVVVTPAPLLYYPAEARDFEFRAVQPQDWFWAGFKQYFRIPDATELEYVTRQPADYCVDDPRVSNPVLMTCAERSGR